MTRTATVDEDGQVAIPPAVRDRLDLEAGETVLFHFDEAPGVRITAVPTDPMDRLETVRERIDGEEFDAQALLDGEREHW